MVLLCVCGPSWVNGPPQYVCGPLCVDSPPKCLCCILYCPSFCLICFCIMLCLTVCPFYIGILFLKQCEKYKIQNPSRDTLVDIENYNVKMYLYFSIQISYWIKCIISLYNSQWGVFIVSIYIVHEKHHNFATQKVTLATDRSLMSCVFQYTHLSL